VAHAGNPSYSGGRDQEDPGSRPSQTNRSARLYLKKQNPSQKRAGGVAQGVGPEFKPQYQKKKEKKKSTDGCETRGRKFKEKQGTGIVLRHLPHNKYNLL
jgi:hypothetical protein